VSNSREREDNRAPVRTDTCGTAFAAQVLRHSLHDHLRRHTAGAPSRPCLGQHHKGIDIAVNRNGRSATVTANLNQSDSRKCFTCPPSQSTQMITRPQYACIAGCYSIGESAQRGLRIHRLPITDQIRLRAPSTLSGSTEALRFFQCLHASCAAKLLPMGDGLARHTYPPCHFRLTGSCGEQ
jgi:hypothetical protein